MSVDPSDDVTFWVFNEYAITRGTPIDSEDGRWGTAFGSFSFAPAAPALASPSDGAAGVSTSPTLSWNASTGATSYGLQVSTSPTFSTTVVNQSGITGTSWQISGLANNTKHYWRVNATSAGGTSDWSSVRCFKTASTAVPPLSDHAQKISNRIAELAVDFRGGDRAKARVRRPAPRGRPPTWTSICLPAWEHSWERLKVGERRAARLVVTAKRRIVAHCGTAQLPAV